MISRFRISSRTLLEELFVAAGVPKERCPALYALLDKKSKMPPDEFDGELSKVLPAAAVRAAVEDIFRAATLDEIEKIGAAMPAVEELRRLFDRLDWYGLSGYALFDIGIVRGLAYYTGTVFEVFDANKSLRAVAGGGRYDRLVEMYGGPATPAVGFAAGDVVLAELMKEKGILPPRSARSGCYLIAIDESDQKECVALARELRGNGMSCEFSLRTVAVGKQMKSANAAGSPIVVFIGGEEGRAGTVKVKDMTTGSETLVARASVAGTLREWLQRLL